MTERIKTLIANLKHLPGVYLMHDKNDTIIYVGKAKDLYKRVSQYFLRPQSGKVFKMVQNVEYFETIIIEDINFYADFSYCRKKIFDIYFIW